MDPTDLPYRGNHFVMKHAADLIASCQMREVLHHQRATVGSSVRVVDFRYAHIDTGGYIAVKKRFPFESSVATFSISKHASGRFQFNHYRSRPMGSSIVVRQVNDGNRREKPLALADRP